MKKAINKKEWTQWKAEYIIEDQKKNSQPFIWIDDHAPLYWTDFVKANTISPSKIILTNSKIGLTIEDIEELSHWSNNNLSKETSK